MPSVALPMSRKRILRTPAGLAFSPAMALFEIFSRPARVEGVASDFAGTRQCLQRNELRHAVVRLLELCAISRGSLAAPGKNRGLVTVGSSDRH